MKNKPFRQVVLEHIELNWPINTKEIAKGLGMKPDNGAIKRISYHIKNLEKDEKVMTRRVGKALVAWPQEIERLRMIHELLRTG
ncbi:MAG: helix-turn-helix transcriptional regulator [Candidatus Aenigmarchaeota archaeon]|nr:helix-turn-helix transcriptional regulator [Candidatus Aenigmarchaeota archaeon]